MPLPLPKLDDRTYADLVAEARALIPTYDPDWTDHNPSDPGITLVELFAWLAEMLIYRVDQIPQGHQLVFLRLLNGPDWQPGPDLAEDIRASVIDLRRRYRAVTVDDHEALARGTSDQVARAKCVPGRDLGFSTEQERERPRPGHVSVIVVPKAGAENRLQPTGELVQTVADHLEPGRLLTTRLHVIGPVYASFGAEILVARRADVGPEELRLRVAAGLQGFLDRQTGGPAGGGWPFGRDIYVSELYELLEKIPGVDYVPDISFTSRYPAGMTRRVDPVELWHENGDLIGLGLAAHHLPYIRDDWIEIVSATAFVPVRLTIAVEGKAKSTPAKVRCSVKTAVKRHFQPRHGGPDGTRAWAITTDAIPDAVLERLRSQYRIIKVDELDTLVRELPEIAQVDQLVVTSDPSWLLLDEAGSMIAVVGRAGELADVAIDVTVSG